MLRRCLVVAVVGRVIVLADASLGILPIIVILNCMLPSSHRLALILAGQLRGVDFGSE